MDGRSIGWGSFDEGYKTFKTNLDQRGKNARGAIWDLFGMGCIRFQQGNFAETDEIMMRVFEERKKHEIVWGELEMTTLRFLAYKELGKDFDLQIIRDLIKNKEDKSEDFSEHLYFRMYQLLGDKKYLIKSFEKIQEALKKVDEDLKEVYLSYPVEKLIIAEYDKVLKKTD